MDGQAVNITACITAASFSDFLRFGIGSQINGFDVKTYLSGNPVKPEPGSLSLILPDLSGTQIPDFTADEYWTIASTGTTLSADY